MNSGQKVGELKWIVLKIIAKNYDNRLEALTETKEACLKRNRILLGKFKMDSVPETNAALPKSGFIHGTRDSLGNGSTDFPCSQCQLAAPPGLQTGWEFNKSLIHPLPKPMEDFQPASRGSPPGPASLELLPPGLWHEHPSPGWLTPLFFPISMPFFSLVSLLCIGWWWQVMGTFLVTHFGRRL